MSPQHRNSIQTNQQDALDIFLPGENSPPETGYTGLQEYVTVLRRRFWLMFFVILAVVALGMLYTLTRRPIYESTAKIVVSSRTGAPVAQDDAPLVSDVQALTRNRSIDTQLEIITSPDILNEAFEELPSQMRTRGFGSTDLPDWAWRAKVRKGTDVIAISARAYTPDAAAHLANTIADTYFKRDMEQSSAATRQARKYAEQKLAEAVKELSEANAELARYKQDSGLFAADVQLAKFAEQVAELSMSLNDARSEVQAKQKEVAALQGQFQATQADVVASRSVQINPQFAAIRAKVNELQSERAALLQEYADGSREIKNIENRIREEENRLRQTAETIVGSTMHTRNPVRDTLSTQYASSVAALAAASARVNALEGELNARKQATLALPDRERVLTELIQRVSLLQRTHETLTTKHSALLLSEQSTIPSGMLVSRAYESARPAYPNRQSSLVVFLMFGAALAAAAAIVAERLDRRVHDESVVEQSSGADILSYVPRLAGGTPQLSAGTPDEGVWLESFRILRNNIALAGIDQQMKVIAVTSPGRGEGKTTTATNLAAAMVTADKRVLLVDADLRRPSLHSELGIGCDPGLIGVLRGDVSLEDAIVRTGIENVFCLPSGQVIPHAVDLLNSSGGRELFDRLAEQYDVVLVDCPPIVGLGDVQVISRLVDGVMMVVSMEYTSTPHLQIALRMLALAGTPMLGVVLNRVDVRRGYGYCYYGSYEHVQ